MRQFRRDSNRRRRLDRPALIVLVLCVLTGCSIISHGRLGIIQRQEVDAIRLGVDTQQEIVARFGQPQYKLYKPNGTEVFVYSHGVERSIAIPFILTLGRAAGAGQTLTVSFQNGIVVDYEYKVDQRSISH